MCIWLAAIYILSSAHSLWTGQFLETIFDLFTGIAFLILLTYLKEASSINTYPHERRY